MRTLGRCENPSSSGDTGQVLAAPQRTGNETTVSRLAQDKAPALARLVKPCAWGKSTWKEVAKTRFPSVVSVLRSLRYAYGRLLLAPYRLWARIGRSSVDLARIYDRRFFESIAPLEVSSAAAVARILVEEFHPASVIDVGCGIGIYLRAFRDLGIDVLGVDGSDAALSANLVDRRCLRKVDLRHADAGTFRGEHDLCICFEVAEHLPQRHARRLVGVLAQTSDVICFTGASPGQCGRDHVNEQPKSYWISLFDEAGFGYQREAARRLRRRLRDRDAVWWLHRNLMVFARRRDPM